MQKMFEERGIKVHRMTDRIGDGKTLNSVAEVWTLKGFIPFSMAP